MNSKIKKMNSKGQISIEFMLIILIVLVYLTSIILPAVTSIQNSAYDIQAVTQTEINAQKLINSIKEIGLNSGDARKTIQLFLTEDSIINCDDSLNEINYSINLKHPEEVTGCLPANSDGIIVCEKTISLPSSINLTCLNNKFDSEIDSSPLIEISKTNGDTYVVKK